MLDFTGSKHWAPSNFLVHNLAQANIWGTTWYEGSNILYNFKCACRDVEAFNRWEYYILFGDKNI